jgi:hypothetical protein
MEHIKLSLGSIQDIVKNDFNYDEEIKLLQFLVNKLGLKEITDFVKENKLNDKTVRNRLSKNYYKLPIIKISNTKFIMSNYIIK